MTLEIDRVRIARSGLEDPSLIGGQERLTGVGMG